jgi:hypothetical protein
MGLTKGGTAYGKEPPMNADERGFLGAEEGYGKTRRVGEGGRWIQRLDFRRVGERMIPGSLISRFQWPARLQRAHWGLPEAA